MQGGLSSSGAMARHGTEVKVVSGFQAAQVDAIKQMKVLLGEVVNLDASANEEILFYDERESCKSFLGSGSNELSTDVFFCMQQ